MAFLDSWRLLKQAHPPAVSSRISRFLTVRTSNTLAALTVAADVVVPENEVWVLKAFSSVAVPNAAAQVGEHNHSIIAPGGAPVVLFNILTDTVGGTITNPPIAESSGLVWEGELIIPPGYIIRALATFGTAAANTVNTFILGHVLTPESWPIYRTI